MVSMAGRDSEHTYTKLYGMATTGNTEVSALVMPFSRLMIHVVKSLINLYRKDTF